MTAAASGPHVTQAARMLARAMALFRIGGVAQMGFALLSVGDEYRRLVPAFALAALVAAESAVIAIGWWRRGRIDPRVATADLAFWAVAMIVQATMPATSEAQHTWAFFMYPFSIVAAVALGVAYHRLRSVLVAATAVAVAYCVAVAFLQGQPLWNIAPNALTYYANATVTWLVARELLRSGRRADEAESLAVARAGELAAERESARIAAALHDRVLQTLEMLSHDTSPVTAPDLRAHLAGEAAWLRALVTDRPGRTADLLAGLRLVVREQTLRGLRVEFGGSALAPGQAQPPVLPEAVEAVCGAVRESLTNVGKHSGVDRAVVRAAFDQGAGLVVSIVDQGSGFDPGRRTDAGFGVSRSIVERIEAVGGAVRIDSTPGAGTHIELRIPPPPRRTTTT